MGLLNIKNIFNRFNLRGLKSFRRNTEGVSAIEFAIVAPVMVFIYFGGMELSLLMQADRRVTTVAATIGDLASRETVLDDNDIADIFSAAGILIIPLDSATARMRISNLVADGNGVVTVDWSDASANFSPRAPGSNIPDIPNGVIANNGSAIMAEVEYMYQSELDYLPSARQTLRDTFYLRPRRTNLIICLLYTSPSPRDRTRSRMPSSA